MYTQEITVITKKVKRKMTYSEALGDAKIANLLPDAALETICKALASPT
tara:strand:+ start:1911 stop:2057 length:147 start_codon:yes stop_codon:yes gene_type:complete